MVLTDREIQAAINCKQISINPSPNAIAYSSTSVDLTFGKYIRLWRQIHSKGVESPIVCPSAEGYKFAEFSKEYSDLKELDERDLYSSQMFSSWDGLLKTSISL